MMTTIRAVALAACLWMGLAAPQVFAQNAYSPDRPDANFMARDQAIRNKTDVKIPDYDPALKMNMAKSLIRQTGLPCDPGAVGDPYLAPGKVNGQAVHVWVIEVGCQDRRGFLLESREAGRASAYPIGCLEAAAIHDRQSDAPVCKLPSNAAPFAWLTDPARPFLPDCAITRARFVGENETSHRETYEIGCQTGKAGGVLVVPNYRASDTHVAYLNCLKVLHTRFECVLTQDAEAVAALAGPVRTGAPDCDLVKAEFIGGKDGLDYYEVACRATAGFVMAVDASGAFKTRTACDQAQAYGGCRLQAAPPPVH